MVEENPLHFVPNTTCSRSNRTNRSGRPSNENLIKFSPQPRSLISQMLRKIKENHGPVSSDSVDATQVAITCVDVDETHEYDSDTGCTLYVYSNK